MIAAVTRMREGRICVGAIEIQDAYPSRNLRLHQPDGSYYELSKALFRVGDLYEITFIDSPNRRPPHTEDCRVQKYERIGSLEPPLADAFLQLIQRNQVVRLYHGDISAVFDGMLDTSTDSPTRYISHAKGVPSFSTCFWIPASELEVWRSVEGRIRLYSMTMNLEIPYVSIEPLPEHTIPAGGLLRLSLARWWSRKPREPQRCYLQASHFYGVPSS